MPGFLRRYFATRRLEFHLGIALALGLVFRSLTAYFAYGPMAMDDYIDGISPAIQWEGGTWPMLSAGRSYLLVWFLGAILRVGRWLGIQAVAVEQVRFLCFCLGVFSLATIAGGYCYVKSREDRGMGPLFLVLLSLFFLMPLASTRAFGETVSMPWVMLGFGVAEWAKARRQPGWFAVGILCLGASVLFRYQNGLLFVAYLLWLAVSRQWLWFKWATGVGTFILAAEMGIDVLGGHTPLHTLVQYLRRNEGGAAGYGVQPWYTHIAALAACTLFPFSLVFGDRVGMLFKKHGAIAVCLIFFVLVHSLIPHKEERFMFPVIPLVLLLLAAAWHEKGEAKAVRCLYFPVFIVVNFCLLGLLAVSNTQAGSIEPIVEAQKHYDSGVFLETNTYLDRSYLGRGVFLRKPFAFERLDLAHLNSDTPEIFFATHPKDRVVIFTAAPETGNSRPLQLLEGKASQRLKCTNVRQATSLSDRIIFRLNPERNRGRRPVFYLFCERTQ